MRWLALVLALPAAAEERIVPPAEFEALSTGETWIFEQDGQWAGAEQYGPGKQVIWQYADGSCARGAWEAEGDALCFSYETRDDVQCWFFIEDDAGYVARPGGAQGTERDLRLVFRTPTPLQCEGEVPSV